MNFGKALTTDFQQRMNKLFSHLTIDSVPEKDFCKNAMSKIELRSYQKFIGEYLTSVKNYKEGLRGMLIIHGLGSGKTKTSINAISKLVKESDSDFKGLIILLPASLKGEWESEFSKIDVKPEYISYNAPNVMDQYYKLGEVKLRKKFDPKKDNYFDKKLVIIEESHIFFQNAISGKARQAIELWNKMYESEGSRFLLLTGTPISGDPYELAPVFNLLRKTRSGVPLFPTSYGKFHEYFVSEENNSMKNKAVFQDRIVGLVSYYKGIKDPNRYVVPEYLGTAIVNCPMGQSQWAQYTTARYEEINMEEKTKFRKREFQIAQYKKPGTDTSGGTYKVMSAQSCNFTFPSDIEKKYRALKSQDARGSPTEYKWKLLEDKYKDTEKYIFDNIGTLSGKASILLKNILSKSSEGKKIFIYSRFKILGVKIISILLRQNGYTQIKESDMSGGHGEDLEDGKRFIVIDGDTKDKYKLINFYNRKDNSRGQKCRFIIGTSVVAAGVNIFDVREEHIYEPQWRHGIIEQIRGRGIRTCSHSSLPIEDRDVKVFLYISTPPNKTYRETLIKDQGLTTDEFLYSIAKEKDVLNKSFIEALKEAAVDCKFNLAHNVDSVPIKCRYCINSPPRLLFPDDLKKHIVEGSYCVTREKDIELYDFRDGYKIDLASNIYKWSEKKKGYEEVGYYDKDTDSINIEGEGFDLF